MTLADDTILEFLLNDGNEELVSTPAFIEMNIDYSGSTVRKRIRKLRNAGLVEYENPDRSSYQITRKGKDYLNGDLDKEDLPDPEE